MLHNLLDVFKFFQHAQLFYYIMLSNVVQFGWGAVQISHLSMITELVSYIWCINLRERKRVRGNKRVRERGSERQTDRQTETRQIETDRDRQRQTETDRDRQRQTETDRDRHIVIERDK